MTFPNDHLQALSDSATERSAIRRVVVYVCTYRRNDALGKMLDSLAVTAQRALPGIELGVVVVDDNKDGSARSVADASTREFPLGLHYRLSASGNIATARNTGLEAAMELADWVAMVDDDQVVVPDWLTELMGVQQRYNAEAVTAPVYMKFPDDSPSWLTDQPFADLWGTPKREDGSPTIDLQTANSVISTAFLKDNPTVRFSHDLGQSGGEDMVFYRAAVAAGLDARYSRHAVNWELEPPERATYRYQLRRALWHGNTDAVTTLRSGRATHLRVTLRAGKRAVMAAVRPIRRTIAGESPQLRFALAQLVLPVGMMIGVAGVKLDHV